MAYIGKQPLVGNFVKLDTITTSATTTFNLLNGGVAYFPQTANNCLVSLNGILQAPTDSYTISGSTIVFSNALTTSDVIDFIIVLGDVLNIGTPSDNTVSLAKLTATGTKDSTTFLRGDNTFAAPSSDYVLLATTDASSSAAVSFDGYFSSTYKNYMVLVSNAIPATNDVSFRFRLRRSNADITTSNYNSTKFAYWKGASTNGTGESGGWDTDHVNLVYAGVRSTTSYGGCNSIIYIMNPLGTDSYKAIVGTNTYYHNNSSILTIDRNDFTAMLDDATTALSGISFFMNSGNIASGNFKLYGIK